MKNEYICKADAIDAINANADDLEQNGAIPFAQGARAMAIVVEQMPSADVVPAVRCKDCCFLNPEHNYHCAMWSCSRKKNGFCDRGKRREE